MKLWSYNNGDCEVVVHKWNIRDHGITFYTVLQVFKDGFGKELAQSQFECQTFTEASELASNLIGKQNLEQ